MTDPFADIRPYRDDEVAPVLARLLDDSEFLGAIASLRLGRWAAIAPALLRPVVRFMLAREVRGVPLAVSVSPGWKDWIRCVPTCS